MRFRALCIEFRSIKILLMAGKYCTKLIDALSIEIAVTSQNVPSSYISFIDNHMQDAPIQGLNK